MRTDNENKINQMRLTAKALKAINTPAIRLLLAISLGCNEQTIIRYIGSNHDNLTKAAALNIIKKETGLKESEILTEDKVVASRKLTA